MYPRQRLTWEDEVRLSDALYEARKVKKRLGDSKTPTPEEQQILDAGVAAADELVVAHSGVAQRVASEVLFGSDSSSTMDFEDLVQIGMISMYACTAWFDARVRRDGIKKDTGNRFSVYCRQYIKRDMHRALRRGDAPLSGSIAAAERTREWLSNRDRLERELGRRPTPREVSEFCGIALSTIDMTLIGRKQVLGQPIRGEGLDSEDAPVLDAPEPERTDEVDADLATEAYVAALDRTLRELLPEDEADAFSLYLGVDRAIPRAVNEVAREMGMKVADANETIGRAIARLRHPQNVKRVHVLAREALDSVEQAEPVAGAA